MAEFLIYDKDNWLDALTPAEVMNKAMQFGGEAFLKKHEHRLRRGDIIEMHEDGFWDNRGFDEEAFRLVTIPGLEASPELCCHSEHGRPYFRLGKNTGKRTEVSSFSDGLLTRNSTNKAVTDLNASLGSVRSDIARIRNSRGPNNG